MVKMLENWPQDVLGSLVLTVLTALAVFTALTILTVLDVLTVLTVLTVLAASYVFIEDLKKYELLNCW